MLEQVQSFKYLERLKYFVFKHVQWQKIIRNTYMCDVMLTVYIFQPE